MAMTSIKANLLKAEKGIAMNQIRSAAILNTD